MVESASLLSRRSVFHTVSEPKPNASRKPDGLTAPRAPNASERFSGPPRAPASPQTATPAFAKAEANPRTQRLRYQVTKAIPQAPTTIPQAPNESLLDDGYPTDFNIFVSGDPSGALDARLPFGTVAKSGGDINLSDG